MWGNFFIRWKLVFRMRRYQFILLFCLVVFSLVYSPSLGANGFDEKEGDIEIVAFGWFGDWIGDLFFSPSTAEVSISVKDGSTGDPLKSATVKFKQNGQIVAIKSTGTTGQTSSVTLEVGTALYVTIYKSGYETTGWRNKGIITAGGEKGPYSLYRDCGEDCDSLSYECGTQTICGKSVNCGTCATNAECVGGVCKYSCPNPECSAGERGCASGNRRWYCKVYGTSDGCPEKIYSYCNDDQTCVSGACERPQCECGSGPCCDGCNFLPTSVMCDDDSYLNTVEYGCPWGTSCGDDVGKRVKERFCPGNSGSCTGALIWSDYSVYDGCLATEKCLPGESTCNYDSQCSGQQCSDECSSGQKGCVSTTQRWYCGDANDGDGCLDKRYVNCNSGYMCSVGECVMEGQESTCVDSDSSQIGYQSEEKFTAGHATAPNSRTKKDSCSDSNTILERYCSSTTSSTVSGTSRDCGSGYECKTNSNGEAYCGEDGDSSDDSGEGVVDGSYIYVTSQTGEPPDLIFNSGDEACASEGLVCEDDGLEYNCKNRGQVDVWKVSKRSCSADFLVERPGNCLYRARCGGAVGAGDSDSGEEGGGDCNSSQEETCNGIDDDCDGEVDEGDVCGVGKDQVTQQTSGYPQRDSCEDYVDSGYNYEGCGADSRCEVKSLEDATGYTGTSCERRNTPDTPEEWEKAGVSAKTGAAVEKALEAGADWICVSKGGEEGEEEEDEEEEDEEICDNREDDDGDELIDCLDDDCEDHESCGCGDGEEPCVVSEKTGKHYCYNPETHECEKNKQIGTDRGGTRDGIRINPSCDNQDSCVRSLGSTLWQEDLSDSAHEFIDRDEKLLNPNKWCCPKSHSCGDKNFGPCIEFHLRDGKDHTQAERECGSVACQERTTSHPSGGKTCIWVDGEIRCCEILPDLSTGPKNLRGIIQSKGCTCENTALTIIDREISSSGFTEGSAMGAVTEHCAIVGKELDSTGCSFAILADSSRDIADLVPQLSEQVKHLTIFSHGSYSGTTIGGTEHLGKLNCPEDGSLFFLSCAVGNTAGFWGNKIIPRDVQRFCKYAPIGSKSMVSERNIAIDLKTHCIVAGSFNCYECTGFKKAEVTSCDGVPEGTVPQDCLCAESGGTA